MIEILFGGFFISKGELLGTFTKLEKNGEDVCKLVEEYANELPIAKTSEIGHGNDSKAIRIGEMIKVTAR